MGEDCDMKDHPFPECSECKGVKYMKRWDAMVQFGVSYEVCHRPEFAGRIMCGFYPCSWKKIEKDKD
jgi:hypothetical protein